MTSFQCGVLVASVVHHFASRCRDGFFFWLVNVDLGQFVRSYQSIPLGHLKAFDELQQRAGARSDCIQAGSHQVGQYCTRAKVVRVPQFLSYR